MTVWGSIYFAGHLVEIAIFVLAFVFGRIPKKEKSTKQSNGVKSTPTNSNSTITQTKTESKTEVKNETISENNEKISENNGNESPSLSTTTRKRSKKD